MVASGPTIYLLEINCNPTMTDTSLTSPNLPHLARSLSHAGFSAEKIRNRHQFLDNHGDPHIPVETIRG